MIKNKGLIVGGGGGAFLALLIGMLDLTTNTAATALATTAISIPHINPPPKGPANLRHPIEPTAFYLEMRWGDGLPHDLDVWVECETRESPEAKPSVVTVGYKQTKSGWLVIDIDDLGLPSVLNLERVTSNSQAPKIPPNTTCRVNAYLYHTHGGALPLKGSVTFIMNKDAPGEKLVASLEFELRNPQEERTIILASWDQQSMLVDQSLSVWPKAPLKPIAGPRVTSSYSNPGNEMFP